MTKVDTEAFSIIVNTTELELIKEIFPQNSQQSTGEFYQTCKKQILQLHTKNMFKDCRGKNTSQFMWPS